MNKTVTVTTEKQYRITLVPEVMTQEFVDEFESYMFELEGDTLDENINDLHAYVARQLTQGEEDFIEGVGPIASVRTVELIRKAGKKINVIWKDIYEDIETEVE